MVSEHRDEYYPSTYVYHAAVSLFLWKNSWWGLKTIFRHQTYYGILRNTNGYRQIKHEEPLDEVFSEA